MDIFEDRPPDRWILDRIDSANFILSFRYRIAKHQVIIVLWVFYFWSVFFSNQEWKMFSAKYWTLLLVVLVPVGFVLYLSYRKDCALQKILDRLQLAKPNDSMNGIVAFVLRIGMFVVCAGIGYATHFDLFRVLGAGGLLLAYVLGHTHTYPRGPRGVKKEKEKRSFSFWPALSRT